MLVSLRKYTCAFWVIKTAKTRANSQKAKAKRKKQKRKSGGVTQKVHVYFLSDSFTSNFAKTQENKQNTKDQKAKSKIAGVTQEVRMYFLSDAQIRFWNPVCKYVLCKYVFFKWWRHSKSTYDTWSFGQDN